MLEKTVSKYLYSSLKLCPKRLRSTFISSEPDTNAHNECLLDLEDHTPEEYVNSKQFLSKLRTRIPKEYLARRKIFDSLYLINPYVARKLSSLISPHLEKNHNKVIAECNPGLGFLTKQLLKKESGIIKLFETSKFFRDQLKEQAAKECQRVQLYSKNLFKVSSYSYLDELDNGGRVKKLLKTVPKKGWTDDPSIVVIGPLLKSTFLKHLVGALASQTSLPSYGRVEIFAIMKPSQYLVLSTETDLYRSRYNYMTVFFNLYFDYELLCKIPRETFIPWDRFSKKSRTGIYNTDIDKLYFIHIVMKKDLPLPLEQLIPLNFFLRRFFSRKARIIPILEFCVPDCGAHIIIPQLEHEHYFKNINIFTEFRELSPREIVGVFREMYNHPNYTGSPFSEMLEADMMKHEADIYHFPGPENSFIDETEELDLDDNFPDNTKNQ